jgi:hypothetical protein
VGGVGVAAVLLVAGCALPRTISIDTKNVSESSCGELRAAAQKRGWGVADPGDCATVELTAQGRLVFEPGREGRVDVTLVPPKRDLHGNFQRQMALLESEARIIVRMVEGPPPGDASPSAAPGDE